MNKWKWKLGERLIFFSFFFLSFEIQSIRPCCVFCYLKACYYVKVGILKYIYTCQRFGYREYFHMGGFSMVVRLFTTCSSSSLRKPILFFGLKHSQLFGSVNTECWFYIYCGTFPSGCPSVFAHHCKDPVRGRSQQDQFTAKVVLSACGSQSKYRSAESKRTSA